MVYSEKSIPFIMTKRSTILTIVVNQYYCHQASDIAFLCQTPRKPNFLANLEDNIQHQLHANEEFI